MYKRPVIKKNNILSLTSINHMCKTIISRLCDLCYLFRIFDMVIVDRFIFFKECIHFIYILRIFILYRTSVSGHLVAIDNLLNDSENKLISKKKKNCVIREMYRRTRVLCCEFIISIICFSFA